MNILKKAIRALFPGVDVRIARLEMQLTKIEVEIGKLNADIRYGDDETREVAMIERYKLRKQREEIIHQLMIEKHELEIQ